MEELRASMEALHARLQAQENVMQQLQGERQQLQQELRQARKAPRVEPAPPPSGVVDTRVIGKPGEFASDVTKFADWIFKMKSYVGAVDHRYQDKLMEAEQSQVTIRNATMEPDVARLSTQLYYIIVMAASGSALDKCHNAGVNEAFEAWRQFVLEWEPKLRSRFVGLRMQAMAYKSTGDIPSALEAFERLAWDYESHSSNNINDNEKIGAVMLGMEDSSAGLDARPNIREEISEITRAQQCGAGKKGKGKRGKADGGENPNAEKECFHRRRTDHVKADCRKRHRDLAAAENRRGPLRAQRAPAHVDVRPLGALPTAAAGSGCAPAVPGRDADGPVPLAATRTDTNVSPRGFDPAAWGDSTVGPARLATATDDPVVGDSGKQSRFGLQGGRQVTARCNEAEVKFAIVSVGEAAGKSNLFLFGTGHQVMLPSEAPPDLLRIPQCPNAVNLEKHCGAHWQPCQAGGPRGATPSRPARPAAEVQRAPAQAPAQEPEQQAWASSGGLGAGSPARARLPESEESRAASRKKLPPEVSKLEFDTRQITRLPFRSWRPRCAAGQASDDAHRPRPGATEGEARLAGHRPAAVKVRFAATVVTGGDPSAMAVARALKFTGRARAAILCDQEGAVKKLADNARDSIERASYEVEKQLRALWSRFEQCCNLTVDLEHKILPPMVRQAAWLLAHFQVKADGRAACERLRGRLRRGQVSEFGESVFYRGPQKASDMPKLDDRWMLGAWLGRSLASDERYVGTPAGARRCRGVYITLDRQIQHGGAPRCPARFGRAKVHSLQCRARFQEIRDRESQAVAEAPAAGSTAPAEQPGAGGRDHRRPEQCRRSWPACRHSTRGNPSIPTWTCPPDFFAAAELDNSERARKIIDWGRAHYGVRSGKALDKQKVHEGRVRELAHMERLGVAEPISIADARSRGPDIVYSKWLGDEKPAAEDEQAVRPRLAATQVNTYSRGGVTQATPPIKAPRVIASVAATKINPKGQRDKLIGRRDIRAAFFRAAGSGMVVIIPPRGLASPGVGWRALKAMHGAREASEWGNEVTDAMKLEGARQVAAVPMMFVSDSFGYVTCCHGDDFPTAGRDKDSRGAPTPSSRSTAAGRRDRGDDLEGEAATTFKQGAGASLHLSINRPTTQFATSQVMAGTGMPKVLRGLQLQRVARYIYVLTEVRLFRYQQEPGGLCVHADTDWAADEPTKSTSCTVERYGDHMLAEFSGIARAVAIGNRTSQILCHMGLASDLLAASDSSAARGICARTGSGKVRNSAIKELRVQETLRNRELELAIVDALLNLADIGTKAPAADRLDFLTIQEGAGRTAHD
ncbi:unnamed protein product [Prorocentrum cordatum]|uniref:Uncharacterized protein n=1 Tax=Prorocentrum cordatum TaxID=2364126 RepID=A0ABN9W995_9DINO|nr:unnamed protein product [Polarella glacialis]